MTDTKLTPTAPIYHDPQHWRDRSEEIRALASPEFLDLECRARMLRLADDYEYLARRAEERNGGTK
jgi:hypothetical protein